MHRYQDLIKLFDSTFYQTYNTRLIKGDEEPIYIPANQTCDYNQIVFAHGYFASGLHEIAHWCVAGKQRRQLEDYGYWYLPDGRDNQQQADFEKVEIRPQAYEWILSEAAQFNYRVSCDNLNGSAEPDRHAFRQKIRNEVAIILEQGLPPRVAALVDSLAKFYNTQLPLKIEQFAKQESTMNSKAA
ncbi:elongation factor P hydroxylase [Saccharobesus litoralis]|uniref:elongation factor P hydroxylase n=1 Tax=Saccharobesus litoralis TaxID=2172099 RepID=UPI001900CE47|nr:elongation factor P hydroxylase [Saccharobesus litoralis]